MKDQPVKAGEIEHIGIVVRDLQKAIDFYSAALGIGPFRIFEMGARGRQESPRAKHRLGLCQAGNVTIELIELPEGPHRYKEILETRGEAVHLGLYVANLEQELARAKSLGLSVLSPNSIGALSDGGNSALLGGEGSGGIFIQLLQAKKHLIERVAAEAKELKLE